MIVRRAALHLRRLTLFESLWWLALTTALCAAVVGLVRVWLGWLSFGHYNKITNSLALGAGIVCLAFRRRQAVDAITLLSCVMLVQGIAVGVAAGGGMRYFVAHAYYNVFFLVLYAAARGARYDSEWLDQFLLTASRALVGAYLVVMGLFWAILLLGRSMYLGVGTGDLLLPLAYGAVRRRWTIAFASLALILLSGKRGVYLAALAICFLLLPLPTRRRLTLHAILGAFGVLVFVALLFLTEPVVMELPFAGDLFSKWYLLNPLRPGFDASTASSGRWGELQTSFEFFNSRPASWIVGLGFGWNYVNTAETQGSDTFDVVTHYVHMSPVNYLLTYGVPAGLAFLTLVWILTARGYAASLRRGLDSPEYAMAVYFVGSLVSGLTGFSYATDPLFPLALGLLASLSSSRLWPTARASPTASTPALPASPAPAVF